MAGYVNAKKKSSENSQKVVEIAERLVDVPKDLMIVSPSRSYVKEGDLVKVNEKGKLQERHFFLFNDLLGITRFTLQLILY